MDENRMSGTAKNLGGKVEEGLGRATGDAKTRVQGQMREAEGSIQDLYGQAVDSASQTAGSFEKALRHTIENQPYRAVAIAFGLGWLFGRMHRPL